MKKIADGDLVRVISTSGDAIKRQREIYKNLEVKVFLQKPFSKDELFNSLQFE